MTKTIQTDGSICYELATPYGIIYSSVCGARAKRDTREWFAGSPNMYLCAKAWAERMWDAGLLGVEC